ncbi:hypothetical protein ACMA1D_10200 [Streptomyces sp. 796.1]|uniref:hypothetical protein n=1 Tax=Streptomyces sp. 796.1 TaxID=3163029 RepID=UPI0039C97642
MDPISVEILIAMASGAAGAAGQRAWEALHTLVRRRPESGTSDPVPATGEDELAALTAAPEDAQRARALLQALHQRAADDPQFRLSLAQWTQQAQAAQTGDGDTSNTVSGGEQHGPVLQGRDFNGLTFNGPGAA